MKSDRIIQDSIICTFFAAVILLLGTAARGWGYLHWESSSFLLNYTSGAPLLQMIFNPADNDWGLYQCRELSYFFDYLDAQCVYFLLKHRIFCFASPIGIFLLLCNVFIQQYAFRRLFPRLPGIFFTLYAAAFALLPPAAGMIFFRTAKYLTATALSLLISGTALRRLKSPGSMGSPALLFAAAMTAVLSDRQGMFFVTAFTGFLALHQFFKPAARFQIVLKAVFCAMIAGVLSNLFLTPAIVEIIHHYQVDFSYQKDLNVNFFTALAGAAKFVPVNIGGFFSGVENIPAGIFTGFLLLAAVFPALRKHRHILPWAYPFAVLAIFACSGLMVSRHPAILDDGMIFSAYFLPAYSIYSFFLVAALERLPGKYIYAAAIIPAMTILLQLAPFIAKEELVKEDRYQYVYQRASKKLKPLIRNGKVNAPDQLLPYRMELLLKQLQKDQTTR